MELQTPSTTTPRDAVAVGQLAVPKACGNCGAPRLGDYCQGCGQHHLAEPLRVRMLVRDFLERQLSLEGGVLRTLVELTLRPGEMIRDYVDGKRQRYMNPVSYMLLSAAVYVLLLPLWFDRFREESLGRLDGNQDAARFMELMLELIAHPLLVSLLTLVFFIPAVRLFFRGRMTTAEACVFALYVSAHASLVGTVATPPGIAAGASPATVSNASFILWVAITGYAAAGYFGYRLGNVVRIVAASAVGFVVMMLSLMLAVAGLVVALRLAAGG